MSKKVSPRSAGDTPPEVTQKCEKYANLAIGKEYKYSHRRALRTYKSEARLRFLVHFSNCKYTGLPVPNNK